MADIPLYTGRAKLPIDYGKSPIEDLDPRLYLEGLKAAQLQPSATSAAIQGLKEGAEFQQQTDLNAARTDYLKQESLKMQMEQQLAPLKAQAEAAQATSAYLKVLTDTQKLKTEQDLLAKKESAKFHTNQAFDAIRGGDVEGGLYSLENNFNDLVESGLGNFTNDDKGTKIAPDVSILNQVAQLRSDAERTGDPQLVDRAQKLVDRFTGVANRSNQILTGKKIEFGQAATQGAIDEDEAALEAAGIIGDETPTSTPSAPLAPTAPPSVSLGQTSTDYGAPTAPSFTNIDYNPDQEAPTGAPEQAQQQQQAYPDYQIPPNRQSVPSVASEELPSVRDIPGPPPILDPDAIQADIPISERLLDLEKSPDSFQRKVEKLQQQFMEQGMTPNAAGKLALDISQHSDYTAPQLEDITKFRQNLADSRTTAQRLRGIVQTMEELKAKGIDLALGPAALRDRTINKGNALLRKPEYEKLYNDVYSQLNALGQSEGFKAVINMGLNGKNIDSPAEQAIIRPLFEGENVSEDKIKQALTVLEAKTQEANDIDIILRSYARKNYNYQDAVNAQEQYRADNPATTPGRIMGVPGVVRNERRARVGDWLDRRLNFTRFKGRTKEGRVVETQPANPYRAAPKISNEVQDGTFTRPKASDIPDRQSKANEATIKGIIYQESTGNPNATGRKTKYGTAKGLMQLTDVVGTDMWKELGFKGEYNPYDPEKNVLMGTQWFNKLLGWFNNDTRIALAAYNGGQNRMKRIISDAMKSAELHAGDVSWDVVKHHLSPEVAAETVPYVEKIMGNDKLIALEGKTPTEEELPGIFASLTSQTAQNNARKVLTDDGLEALSKVADARSVKEVEGTSFGDMVNAFMEANPFVEEAVAEDLGSARKAKETPGFQERAIEAGKIAARGAAEFANAGPVIDLATTPGAVQSAALGLMKTALFGFDKDAGAFLRMRFLGEDYDTAVHNTNAIIETFKQQNPEYFLGGEIVGGFVGPTLALKGVGALGRVAGIGRRAATIAEEAPVAAEVVKKTLGSRATSVAKIAGASGAIGAAQGFGQAAGGRMDNRINRAISEGATGLATGFVLGGAILAGGEIFNSETLRTLIGKVYSKFKGGATPELTPAEAYYANKFADSPGLLDETVVKLTATDNPAASAASEMGSAKLSQNIDAIAKNPSTTSKLQDVARENLDEQGQRIVNLFGDHSNNLPSEVAYDKLAATIGQRKRNLEEIRSQLGDELYEETRQALPKLKTSAKGETAREVPGFQSEEVKKVLEDEELKGVIKDAVKRAKGRLHDESLPDRSFEVMKETKAILYSDSQELAGTEGHRAKEAWKKLREALHNESKAYAKADVEFTKASENIKSVDTKSAKQLAAYEDLSKIKNIKDLGRNLFSYDRRNVRDLMEGLSEAEQQTFKDAAAAYIRDTISDKGSKALSDFTKGNKADLIETIFQGEEAQKIIDGLLQEQRIATTAKGILAPGAQTHQRGAEIASLTDSAKKGIGGGVTEILAGGAATSFGHPYLGAAMGIKGAVKVWRSIGQRVEAGVLKNEQELSDEIAHALYIDKEHGIEFLRNVSDYLKSQKNNKALQAWDRASKIAKANVGKIATRAGTTGAQILGSEGHSFEPEQNRNDQMTELFIKGPNP